MKFNIKSLLTGTTLIVASALNINAVPPNGIELIEGVTIKHPVGEMKVITHKKDLGYYDKKVKKLTGKDSFKNNEKNAELLAENFIKYVLNGDSLVQANVPQKDIVQFVKNCWPKRSAESFEGIPAGAAALKVITANYMREYDRIKQFCKEHETELEAYYSFDQTEEGEELYQKERQILELEEKLRELFFKENRGLKYVKGKSVSRDDLVRLYGHFLEEEMLFNSVKPCLELLNKTESLWFRLDSVYLVGEVYKHFSRENEKGFNRGDGKFFKIGNYLIASNSDEYESLKKFYNEFREHLEEIFKIDNLFFDKDYVNHGSLLENCIREFYQKHKKDLKRLLKLCDEGAELQETKKSDIKVKQSEVSLEAAYKKETEEANKEKFSCIRRSVMPACYFPILYRHFFVKDDPEYSNIEAVNKFLYRALKLHDYDDTSVFIPETISIGLKKDVKKIENYHVNRQGEFLTFKRDRYSSLLHELMHFMNALESFDGSTESADISVCDIGIIKNVISRLTFSREDLPLKKPTFEKKEGEGNDGFNYRCNRYIQQWEDRMKKEPDNAEQEDVRTQLESALCGLYHNGAETWPMYGILICENKQNSGNKQNSEDSEEDSDGSDASKKYEFYYDPINEAVADAECKIINGKREEVVRTGHARFGDEDSRLVKYEGLPLSVEILNKKIGIYKFYFDEGERLRKLIYK